MDDQAQTAVDTPVAIDLLLNDVSPTSQPMFVGGAACANFIELIFDGATCSGGGVDVLWGPSPTFNPVTFTPLPGFTGKATLAYASGDVEACIGAAGCRIEKTIYWAHVTVNVGGGATPPNLVASKAILDQGTPVPAIEAVNGDTVVFRIGAVNQQPAGGSLPGPTTDPSRSRTRCPPAWRSCPRRATRDVRPRDRWSPARRRSCSTRVTR